MTTFDATLLARGWLSVAIASSKDAERPVLHRTEFMASAWLAKRREGVARLRQQENGRRPDGKGYWHPAVERIASVAQ